MHTLDFSSPFWSWVPVAWIVTWIVYGLCTILSERQKGTALVVSGIFYTVVAAVGAWLMALIPRLIA